MQRMMTFNGPALPAGEPFRTVFIRKIVERDASGNPTKLGGELPIKYGARVIFDDVYQPELYLDSGQATLDELPKATVASFTGMDKLKKT